MFVLVNWDFKGVVKVVDTEEIKLGSMNMGNKGGIQKLIKVGNTFIDICNCHLAAGYGDEAILNRR